MDLKSFLEVLQLPIDSQPKAVDRRIPSRTPGFWTVWICRQVIQMGVTLKGLSAEWIDRGKRSQLVLFLFSSVK
ncbi:hypothetical protein Taro_048762 [Colocasia esculenta]|uniref:Uncharacterized protein n=1 Tax=Colocasia esculenta TaxID=4460 RepID=A0A843X914_COLES|nr:hypothetical protein [Colocasia esculenta]